jgi:hypothetical protein
MCPRTSFPFPHLDCARRLGSANRDPILQYHGSLLWGRQLPFRSVANYFRLLLPFEYPTFTITCLAHGLAFLLTAARLLLIPCGLL